MAKQTKLKKEYMAISILAAMKEFNIGRETIVEYLKTKGFQIENKPTAKLDEAMHEALLAKFAADKKVKEEAADLKSEKQKAVSEKVAPVAPPAPAPPAPAPAPVVEEVKRKR
jgi:translation initiation factor IF-2